MNNRNIDTSLFKNISVGNHTACSSSATGSFPFIRNEFCFAIHFFQGGANLLLQQLDVLYKLIADERAHS